MTDFAEIRTRESRPNRISWSSVLSPQESERTREALVLALGGYSVNQFAPEEQRRVIDSLIRLFRFSPDSGLHSAISWLLGHEWGLGHKLSRIETEIEANDRDGVSVQGPAKRNWYVNGQMQTLAVIRGPVEFSMGALASEFFRHPWAEDHHPVWIERTFAIATHEVTRSHRRFSRAR